MKFELLGQRVEIPVGNWLHELPGKEARRDLYARLGAAMLHRMYPSRAHDRDAGKHQGRQNALRQDETHV